MGNEVVVKLLVARVVYNRGHSVGQTVTLSCIAPSYLSRGIRLPYLTISCRGNIGLGLRRDKQPQAHGIKDGEQLVKPNAGGVAHLKREHGPFGNPGLLGKLPLR